MMLKQLKILFVLGCLVSSFSLMAFKMRTHVYVASQTLEAILKGSNSLTFEGVSDHVAVVPIKNPEVLEALRRYPEYYRAGAIGPDGFPDMVEGQIQTHVNLGEKSGVDNAVTYENRRFDQFRSIDHFMLMLKEAYKLPRGDERLQVLSFLYGFANHMSADGFAHEFLDEWSWGSFDLFGGEGTFGSVTEELKHIAAESYIEHFIPKYPKEQLTLKIPVKFLYHIYTMPVYGISSVGEAGSEGGIFYRNLMKIQKMLLAFSGQSNKELMLSSETYDLISDLRRELQTETKSLDFEKNQAISALEEELELDAQDLGSSRGLGGEKKLKEAGKILIEVLKGMHLNKFFEVRAMLLDTFMKKWLEINLCINQNMLWGSHMDPTESLKTDACASVDFEDDPRIARLFQGKLNRAVRKSGGLLSHLKSHSPAKHIVRQMMIHKTQTDYGGLVTNLSKLLEFVSAFADRGLKFHPLQDIPGLEAINEIVMKCREARHGSDHVKAFEGVEVDEDEDEEIDFSDMDVNDKGFRSMIHGTTMFVTWGACKAIVTAQKQVKKVKDVVNRQIEKVINKVKLKLLEKFYQTEYGRVVLALKELEQFKNLNGPAMFMNVAFMAEDLKNNPTYLNLILKRSLNISQDLLHPLTLDATSADELYNKTLAQGEGLVSKIFPDLSSQEAKLSWKGVVSLLLGFVKGKNPKGTLSWTGPIELFDDQSEAQKTTKSWMNKAYQVTGEKKAMHLPFTDQMVKLVRIINNLQIFFEVRGTAIHSLRDMMNVPAERPFNAAKKFYDLDEGTKGFFTIRIDDFYPLKNAITLAKLSLLSKEAMYDLLKKKDPNLRYEDVYFGESRICKEHPFLLCDVLQSLDDPNAYGKVVPFEATYPHTQKVDYNRSVSIWSAADTKWFPQGPEITRSLFSPTQFYARRSSGCQLALTNFVLANKWSVIRDYYLELFDLPPGCQENLSELGL